MKNFLGGFNIYVVLALIICVIGVCLATDNASRYGAIIIFVIYAGFSRIEWLIKNHL